MARPFPFQRTKRAKQKIIDHTWGNQTWLKGACNGCIWTTVVVVDAVVVALPMPEDKATRRNIPAYFFVSLPLLKCYLWIFIR